MILSKYIQAICIIYFLFVFSSNITATNTGTDFRGTGRIKLQFNLFGKPISSVIRPYGSMGLLASGSSTTSSSSFIWQGGIQALLVSGSEELYLGCGLDFGNSSSPGLDVSGYCHLLVFGEITIGPLILQSGLGPYGRNELGEHPLFGMFVSLGISIKLDRYLAVPILIRSDFIFDTATTIPISIMSGISFQIGK